MCCSVSVCIPVRLEDDGTYTCGVSPSGAKDQIDVAVLSKCAGVNAVESAINTAIAEATRVQK